MSRRRIAKKTPILSTPQDPRGNGCTHPEIKVGAEMKSGLWGYCAQGCGAKFRLEPQGWVQWNLKQLRQFEFDARGPEKIPLACSDGMLDRLEYSAAQGILPDPDVVRALVRELRARRVA